MHLAHNGMIALGQLTAHSAFPERSYVVNLTPRGWKTTMETPRPIRHLSPRLSPIPAPEPGPGDPEPEPAPSA